MAKAQRSRLIGRVEQGVLVLRLVESQIHGDAQVDSLGREMLAAVESSGSNKVVLDLQNVQSLASAGFRPLLKLRHKLRDRGGRLVLCHLASGVAKAFQDTRLVGGSGASNTFEVQPDVTAAVAYLNSDSSQGS